MAVKNLTAGTVHSMPPEWQKALVDNNLTGFWEGLTPLARNEWICWVTSAAKAETNTKRISVGVSKLKSGMRRPCCWAGCPHRERNGK